MRFFVPFWLIFCACIALYGFSQGYTANALYWTILTMITALSISQRM